MAAAFIGLGANLGDAVATLQAAMAALRRLGPLQASGLYRTAPVDASGPDFINAVVALDTALAPAALLAQLQALERTFGRERPYRNAPRTLDLDLLLHGDARLDTPALTLPHPRLHQRAFVLRPLLELAPALDVAGLGPLQAHLSGLADQRVQRLPDSARPPAPGGADGQ